MQERGITTTAVIIYVIIATIVIATFSVITTDFYETLKKKINKACTVINILNLWVILLKMYKKKIML